MLHYTFSMTYIFLKIQRYFSVKVNDIEAEALEKFNELVKETKIEDKNVVNIIKTGNEMILFPKYIISLTCRYSNRKQINLFNFFFVHR